MAITSRAFLACSNLSRGATCYCNRECRIGQSWGGLRRIYQASQSVDGRDGSTQLRTINSLESKYLATFAELKHGSPFDHDEEPPCRCTRLAPKEPLVAVCGCTQTKALARYEIYRCMRIAFSSGARRSLSHFLRQLHVLRYTCDSSGISILVHQRSFSPPPSKLRSVGKYTSWRTFRSRMARFGETFGSDHCRRTYLHPMSFLTVVCTAIPVAGIYRSARWILRNPGRVPSVRHPEAGTLVGL